MSSSSDLSFDASINLGGRRVPLAHQNSRGPAGIRAAASGFNNPQVLDRYISAQKVEQERQMVHGFAKVCPLSSSDGLFDQLICHV